MAQKDLSKYGFHNPVSVHTWTDLRANNLRGVVDMEEYEEIYADIFKFEDEGVEINGKLIAKEDSTNFNNKVYKIEAEDGSIKAVFGTVVLDSLMSSINIGESIKIQYLGNKESKTKGHNAMKIFKVFKKRA